MKQNNYSEARCVIFEHSYANLAEWNQCEYLTVEETAPEDEIELAVRKEEVDDDLCVNGTSEEYSNMQNPVTFPEKCLASEEDEIKSEIEILEDTVVKEEVVGDASVNENGTAFSCVPVGYQNTFEKFVMYQRESFQKRSNWPGSATLITCLLNAGTESNSTQRKHEEEHNETETTNVQPEESIKGFAKVGDAYDKHIRYLNARLLAKETENAKLKNKLKLLEEQKKLDGVKILSNQIAVREYEHWCANLANKLRAVTTELNSQKAELSKMKYPVKVMSKTGKYNQRLPLIPHAVQKKIYCTKLGIKSGTAPLSIKRERGTRLMEEDVELKAMKRKLMKLKGCLKINSEQDFECISLE